MQLSKGIEQTGLKLSAPIAIIGKYGFFNTLPPSSVSHLHKHKTRGQTDQWEDRRIKSGHKFGGPPLMAMIRLHKVAKK